MRYTIINEREVIKMTIVKKEHLEFSDKEIEALNLVMDISIGIMREAEDPNLKRIAENININLVDLWNYDIQ